MTEHRQHQVVSVSALRKGANPMTNAEYVWKDLTPKEAETLAELKKKGIPVFAAPIEIEQDEDLRAGQFECLGITCRQVSYYRLGHIKVMVHYTPTDEETYRIMVKEIWERYHEVCRRSRCMIPGKKKAYVRCPDTNRCENCIYEKFKRPCVTSLDVRYEDEDGNEYGSEVADDVTVEDISIPKLELGEIGRFLDAKDPRILQALKMKVWLGMDVKYIARKLNVSPSRIYQLFDLAEEIGKKYKSTME